MLPNKNHLLLASAVTAIISLTGYFTYQQQRQSYLDKVAEAKSHALSALSEVETQVRAYSQTPAMDYPKAQALAEKVGKAIGTSNEYLDLLSEDLKLDRNQPDQLPRLLEQSGLAKQYSLLKKIDDLASKALQDAAIASQEVASIREEISAAQVSIPETVNVQMVCGRVFQQDGSTLSIECSNMLSAEKFILLADSDSYYKLNKPIYGTFTLIARSPTAVTVTNYNAFQTWNSNEVVRQYELPDLNSINEHRQALQKAKEQEQQAQAKLNQAGEKLDQALRSINESYKPPFSLLHLVGKKPSEAVADPSFKSWLEESKASFMLDPSNPSTFQQESPISLHDGFILLEYSGYPTQQRLFVQANGELSYSFDISSGASMQFACYDTTGKPLDKFPKAIHDTIVRTASDAEREAWVSPSKCV